MTWLLQHNFWMVKLLGALVVTGFLANTTTTLLALYLMSDRTTAPAPTPDADDSEPSEGPVVARQASGNDRARQAERTAARILGRNAFCPTCSPAAAPGADGGASHDPAGKDLGEDLSGARRSQLPLVVAATMEHEDPSLSVATLIDTERGVGGLFGVGDLVGGQVEVVHVATGVVHISHNGVLEYIPFGALAAPAKPAKSSASRPAKTAAKKPQTSRNAIDGAAEAIQCTNKGDCVVDRAFVETLIANPKLLVGQGGVAPTKAKDGSPGFRLRGVRKGSLPHLLGLKNGDIITEVGGSPLTMDVAMGLYSKLRHASHVEVTVDRRGTPMRRQLEIRS
ncbi:MAG: type II secretion system protein GspC [Myxococcota bacterium]